MTLGELRQEYASVRIGPVILQEVRRVVAGLIRQYDPQVYAGAADWVDVEDDIVQSVVVDLLLAEGQLDYLMAVSKELRDFRSLLRYQVKRYLARQRRRSIIDNLLDRAKVVLAGSPFSRVGEGISQVFHLDDAEVERRSPTEEELWSAARSVAMIARAPVGSSDRAPQVYTTENLTALLRGVARSLPCTFSLQDLDKILRLLLTDWVASFLYDFEEARGLPGTDLGPEEKVMVISTARQFLDGCTADELAVLRGKLEGRPDQEIAGDLGLARPTVIARKKALLEKMRSQLEDLPERLQAGVMEHITQAAAAGYQEGPSLGT